MFPRSRNSAFEKQFLAEHKDETHTILVEIDKNRPRK